MCPADQICNGTGQRVPAFALYLNTMDSPAGAPAFSEQCDNTTSDALFTAFDTLTPVACRQSAAHPVPSGTHGVRHGL
jgi:hypothetical protein